MTQLSVNVNKIATLRNARGGNVPDLIQSAIDIQAFGAQGITVHPRPDERHIRYQDVRELRPVVRTEFNVEGNPTPAFIELVSEVKPEQVTLVPDAPDALTSNAGWDVFAHGPYLKEVLSVFKAQGIRTSLFLDPKPESVSQAAQTGVDRIELYTGAYAKGFAKGKLKAAVAPYVETARQAADYGLGVNAGHDLNADNLSFLKEKIPWLEEVSIGHALLAEALYWGLENTIQSYLRALGQ